MFRFLSLLSVTWGLSLNAWGESYEMGVARHLGIGLTQQDIDLNLPRIYYGEVAQDMAQRAMKADMEELAYCMYRAFEAAIGEERLRKFSPAYIQREIKGGLQADAIQVLKARVRRQLNRLIARIREKLQTAREGTWERHGYQPLVDLAPYYETANWLGKERYFDALLDKIEMLGEGMFDMQRYQFSNEYEPHSILRGWTTYVPTMFGLQFHGGILGRIGQFGQTYGTDDDYNNGNKETIIGRFQFNAEGKIAGEREG